MLQFPFHIKQVLMASTEVFNQHVDAYEAWFDRHPSAYASELEAVRALLPQTGLGLDVGVGTGRFAAPLGVRLGVEPSAAMRRVAKARGIEVVAGTAETLPFPSQAVDYVLMVTTLCFLDDAQQAMREVYRVLRPGGAFVVGFIERTSPLGRRYEQRKADSAFYRVAHFHSTEEVTRLLLTAGFQALAFRQTLFEDPTAMEQPDPVREGYGEGAFVVIKGEKAATRNTENAPEGPAPAET